MATYADILAAAATYLQAVKDAQKDVVRIQNELQKACAGLPAFTSGIVTEAGSGFAFRYEHPIAVQYSPTPGTWEPVLDHPDAWVEFGIIEQDLIDAVETAVLALTP